MKRSNTIYKLSNKKFKSKDSPLKDETNGGEEHARSVSPDRATMFIYSSETESEIDFHQQSPLEILVDFIFFTLYYNEFFIQSSAKSTGGNQAKGISAIKVDLYFL